MDWMTEVVLLVTAKQKCRYRRRRSELGAGATTRAISNASHLSPLGALYRREYERLSMRYPALDATARDRIIVAMLAHLFLDSDDAELEQAMIEGSPLLSMDAHEHARGYAQPLVRVALDIARRQEARG